MLIAVDDPLPPRRRINEPRTDTRARNLRAEICNGLRWTPPPPHPGPAGKSNRSTRPPAASMTHPSSPLRPKHPSANAVSRQALLGDGLPCKIPFRCLHSAELDNVMMMGKHISVTHIAGSVTRFMGTSIWSINRRRKATWGSHATGREHRSRAMTVRGRQCRCRAG